MYTSCTCVVCVMSHEYRTRTYVRTVSAYDEYVNPTVGNAFATAAFRFGHSQIQGFVHMKGDDFHTKQIVPFDMVVTCDIL